MVRIPCCSLRTSAMGIQMIFWSRGFSRCDLMMSASGESAYSGSHRQTLYRRPSSSSQPCSQERRHLGHGGQQGDDALLVAVDRADGVGVAQRGGQPLRRELIPPVAGLDQLPGNSRQ